MTDLVFYCTMKHKPCKYLKRRVSTSWAILPLPALVEVMRHLSDTDKIACAQVCQHWYNAFLCPIMWRDREFEFGGSRFRPLGQKSVAYALKLGRFLRHMKISCRQLTSHTCETMVRHLETFLDTLRLNGRPELWTLEIQGLELEFWRFGDLRDLVADILLRFFHYQNSLKTFCMTQAQFASNPGTDLLEALVTGNEHQMEILRFETFFQSRQPVFQIHRYQAVMQSFTNLRKVSMSYCCLSEQIVIAWAKSLKGKLTLLKLRCADNEPHDHVISATTWSELTSSCPQLEVEIHVFGFGRHTEVMPILSKTIPLKHFNFFSGFDSESHLGLNTTLLHVANNFHHKLRELDMEFDNFHDEIDEVLMAVVTRCRLLTTLKIKAIMGLPVARYVCGLLVEGRTNLTHVELTLTEITALETESLRDLREDMARALQDQPVYLLLRDDIYFTGSTVITVDI